MSVTFLNFSFLLTSDWWLSTFYLFCYTCYSLDKLFMFFLLKKKNFMENFLQKKILLKNQELFLGFCTNCVINSYTNLKCLPRHFIYFFIVMLTQCKQVVSLSLHDVYNLEFKICIHVSFFSLSCNNFTFFFCSVSLYLLVEIFKCRITI